MGYSEEGYAGDLDAATAATLAAGATTAATGGGRADDDAQRAMDQQQASPSSSFGTSSGIAVGTSSFATADLDDTFLATANSESAGGKGRSPIGGLIGLFTRLWSSFRTIGAAKDNHGIDRSPADILRIRALEAYAIHKLFCDQSTAYIADAFGYAELNDKSVDQQVAYLERQWTPVDGGTAQDLANRGMLVIAGLAHSNGNGQTAVVTPGDGRRDPDGTLYPNVTNGGSPAVQSDGSRTVADVWSVRDRTNVRYYTPGKPKS
ncbi:MAG: hypothetical protein U1E21_15725 [Reyranellaceae bacterium]